MNIDECKKVVVRRDGDHIHEEHIVKDTHLELAQKLFTSGRQLKEAWGIYP